MNITLSSTGKCAALCALTLVSASALAQTYTVKIGGGYIDPRATSSSLEGTLPTGFAGAPVVPLSEGNHLQVMPKSTVLFSVERSIDDHWGAELVLGFPPTHDVKLRVSDAIKAGAATAAQIKAGLGADAFTNPAKTSAAITAAGGATNYVKLRVADNVNQYDDVTVARVKQTAPTLFLNYKFLDATSALRPYIGVGVNYTNFKVTSTEAGNNLYGDGPVRISSTDSIGLAFQMGANYKFDKNWLVSASWATAGVKNNVTIRTNLSEQTLSYRFHPSVFSLMVGYQY
ncbi:OmpW family outer membrane protein [Aquabacterium sp.]|uniref:OmpW/AlkL family protein n=1 Tax=Aquabacterium sp. TaxID=1872578 RepID=UPI0025C01338|nr:OmpW family outer membrane protein [Aquabacterium sp.]